MDEIRGKYPDIQRLSDSPTSTSYNYHIPGYRGDVGVIAAYSRTFCGTCNRIRITPDGVLKTCLYDGGVMNIKDLVRSGASEIGLRKKLLEAFGNRPKDGWEAEHHRNINDPAHESMATIGG
jgi:cyclic pyranopterin phosphate synthase